MDWLVTKQSKIEKQLAKRHLVETGIAMYDLSSSWVEGTECELAAFGHSRDTKRGKMQINYGLLTDPDGRPVAVDVFKHNTSDPVSLKTAIRRVRDSFALKRLIMVADRGMITIGPRKEQKTREKALARQCCACGSALGNDSPYQAERWMGRIRVSFTASLSISRGAHADDRLVERLRTHGTEKLRITEAEDATV